MKLVPILNSKTTQILLLAAISIGIVYYSKKQVGEALHAINPTNNDNIFAEWVDDVGEALTGEDDFQLGGWLYDLTNDETDIING